MASGILETWIHVEGKYLGAGFSETTTFAPLCAASSTYLFPSVFSPATAKNAAPGETRRLSAMSIFICADLSPDILTAPTAFAKSAAVYAALPASPPVKPSAPNLLRAPHRQIKLSRFENPIIIENLSMRQFFRTCRQFECLNSSPTVRLCF